MDIIIYRAQKILSEICKKYRHHDKEMILGIKGEKLHSLDVLNWVNKLNPRPSISLKLAALFHDVDRVVNPKVGGGYQGKRNTKPYFEHKKKHARRSADYIIPILNEIVGRKKIINKMKFLIIHHDDTGNRVEKINDPDLNYLVAADSFSFFTSAAPRFYRAEGEKRTKDKIRFMVDKLPGFAREKLWEYQIENKFFNKLKNEIIKEYYINNNPGKKQNKFCPNCKTRLVWKKKL